MPRKFYLIGHNPNNVQDAVAYLQAGANALEPDVCYDKGSKTFYVHDEDVDFLPSWLYSGPTLMSYLDNLVQALRGNQSLQLALISFDLKAPYSYDINAQLYDTIRTHFSQFFPKVSILTTVGKSKGMSRRAISIRTKRWASMEGQRRMMSGHFSRREDSTLRMQMEQRSLPLHGSKAASYAQSSCGIRHPAAFSSSFMYGPS